MLRLAFLLCFIPCLAQSATITSVTPSIGKAGITVHIVGTGFLRVTKVFFGAVPAISFHITSNRYMRVVVPPGKIGSTVTVVAK